VSVPAFRWGQASDRGGWKPWNDGRESSIGRESISMLRRRTARWMTYALTIWTVLRRMLLGSSEASLVAGRLFCIEVGLALSMTVVCKVRRVPDIKRLGPERWYRMRKAASLGKGVVNSTLLLCPGAQELRFHPFSVVLGALCKLWTLTQHSLKPSSASGALLTYLQPRCSSA
jgi:hypothetical protein